MVDDGKRGALALLDDLLSDCERFQEVTDAGDLLHAIRTTATELKAEFERLATWFVRAEDVANEPFALEDAIQIAEETVRTRETDFVAEVTFTGPLTAIRLQDGRLLASCVDIFFILFENVVRHSGATTPHAAVHLDH